MTENEMITLDTLQHDRLTWTPLTVSTDQKDMRENKANPSEVFCFLPPHGKHICKAAQSQPVSQSFAKELPLAHAQRINFEILHKTEICR